LLELEDPPPLLFLKGRAVLLHRPAVAIVGARAATEVGRRMAEAMGRLLAAAGVTVVSGLARGIDAAAHAGALAAGGDTVAVLGAGMEARHPASSRALLREIGHRGLLVSEFLPSEPALPHHFPRRNRVIAALARAVVVVEAGERSGALITVNHALDLGREVLAVPGSVENPRARGTNALLRDGAGVLPYPEAVLEALPELVAEAREAGKPTTGPGALDLALELVPPPPRGLEPVWRALGPEPRGLDQVAGLAGLEPAEALAGLAALELGGWALQCPGMRFRRAG
jgi:DNA processing protein